MPSANHSCFIISVYRVAEFFARPVAPRTGLEKVGGRLRDRGGHHALQVRRCFLDIAQATGRRSVSNVESSFGPPQPCTAAASFQPRSTASCMPVFMPKAPVGELSRAESPTRNTLRAVRSATNSRRIQGMVERIFEVEVAADGLPDRFGAARAR